MQRILKLTETKEFKPFELKKDSAISTMISGLLSLVSRDVWRCDPEIHQAGVTYSSIIESIHSIAIANPRMLISYYSNDCNNYKRLDLDDSLRLSQLSARHGLNYSHDYTQVKLFDCQNVEPGASICLATPDAGSEDHRIIERPENCKNKQLILLNENHCVCSYTNLKTRQFYVNLDPMMADTKKNYVVTGARFKKDTDHDESMVIFNIEIQQGRLGPDGKVDQATVEWKTNKKLFSTYSVRYHSHTIDTLELEGTEDEVVVGLKFSDVSGKILLEPLVKKFDLGSGQLSTEPSSKIPVVDDNKCEKSVNLKNADIPTLSKSPSYLESECGKVTFGPSSFGRDRGQTTVPYVDIQEVVTKPASALSGASLYYKSANGYGGFVAMKLKTYNFAERLFP